MSYIGHLPECILWLTAIVCHPLSITLVNPFLHIPSHYGVGVQELKIPSTYHDYLEIYFSFQHFFLQLKFQNTTSLENFTFSTLVSLLPSLSKFLIFFPRKTKCLPCTPAFPLCTNIPLRCHLFQWSDIGNKKIYKPFSHS